MMSNSRDLIAGSSKAQDEPEEDVPEDEVVAAHSSLPAAAE